MTRVLLALGLVVLFGSLVYLAGAQTQATPADSVSEQPHPATKASAATGARPNASGSPVDAPLTDQVAEDAAAPPLLAMASRSGLLLLCVVLMTIALLLMHRRHPRQPPE